MKSAEIYNHLYQHVSNAIEVLACIPKPEPISKGFHEGVSLVQSLSGFQTAIWLLTGDLFGLSNL